MIFDDIFRGILKIGCTNMSAEIFFQKHKQRTDFPNICHVLFLMVYNLPASAYIREQATSTVITTVFLVSFHYFLNIYLLVVINGNNKRYQLANKSGSTFM